MPQAIQPINQGQNVYSNTTKLKVYTRDSINGAWVIDTALICESTTISSSNSIGSASFFILPSTNDFADPQYIEDVEKLKGMAAEFYHVSMSDTYKVPIYVKVTDELDGAVFPVFYGYINSCEIDAVGSRCRVSALSYAGLLDTVELAGSWFLIDDQTPLWFQNVIPIYNPNGNGNMSDVDFLVVVQSGNKSYSAIDETLVTEGNEKLNKFPVREVIGHIVAHMQSTEAVIGDQGFGHTPWKFASTIYKDIIIDITQEAQDLLEESFAVDSYTYFGKSIWQSLVELVESVDDLVLSEVIATDQGQNELPVLRISKMGV